MPAISPSPVEPVETGQQVNGVLIALQQDLAPEGFCWDGGNFWTAHEPGWEMDSPGDLRPGGEDFQAYIFKHANDNNKTAIEMYIVSHHYNVIGIEFINGELWTSSWINENLGRIYQLVIRGESLVVVKSWDTELCCDGLAWDGLFLWGNMGNEIGIVKFDVSNGLREIERYPPPRGLKTEQEFVHAKGLAWDGRNLWSCYKHTSPVIIKHNMDEDLSVAAGYPYEHQLLNFHPGDLAIVDGIPYTSSSDPGTGTLRGGRIVKHKPDEVLSVDEIYYYNRYK